METIDKRYESAQEALQRFKEALDLLASKSNDQYYRHFRNSVIKSFEFSFDTFWKLLKQYLETNRQIVI